jgi:cell division protein FtsA
VVLLDIGGGTTDIAVFSEGSIKHTAVLPVGGNYITSDIATGLRTPLTEAEKIKLKYGCSFTPMIPKDEVIEVPSVGGREPREVTRQILGRIIEPRTEEILNLAYKEIIKSGYEDILAAGVVLTGGTAIMDGITQLAEHVFNMPVRRGCPTGVGGLIDVVNSPMYATGVGLVIYGSKTLSKDALKRFETNIFSKTISNMKKWFLEFF